VVPQL
jgi:hypothetical protein